jgi:hypothetical protein
MTPRTRAILVIGLGLALLLILIGVIVFLLNSRKPTATPAAVTPTATSTTPISAPIPLAPNPLNPPSAAVTEGRTAAAQMAELFAERYGSYSNQGDFQNLRDLLPVMTDGYRAKTEAYLATAAAADLANYQGVTSLKISTQVHNYDESGGNAVIAVNLQQQKSGVASGTQAVSYRSLSMELKKVGDSWKVDSATWEN